MSVLPRPVEFTNRDFDSMRARLVELARSAFPDWTDFDEANFGTLLLEMHAFVFDVLMYYTERLSRESFLATCVLRESVKKHTEQRGYRLRGATAARADVVLGLEKVPAGRVVIPRGTVIRTEEITDAVRHQLLADVEIARGADPPEIFGTTEHSESWTERFSAEGRADFEIQLRQPGFLDGTAEVSSPDGAFVEVSSFYGSSPADLHFVVKVDRDERARLIFGSGRNGKAPAGTVTVSYKTGGGRSGRVEATALRVVEGSFQDEFGTPVRVSVLNPAPSYGGADRESVAEGKRNAQRFQRAARASVNREDFEIHAESVKGVARALMLTADEDPTLNENSGDLYIVPDGGGAASQSLKDAVRDYILTEHPPFTTFDLRLQDPIYLPVTVEVWITFRSSATEEDRALVGETVASRLRAFFGRALVPERDELEGTADRDEAAESEEPIGFGFHIGGGGDGEVAWSSVFNVVRDTHGVKKIAPDGLLLNGAPHDVTLSIREFPILTTVRVLDAETSAEVHSS